MNKLIIFFAIFILAFIIIVFGIGINFNNPVFIVDATSHAILVEEGIVKEILDPGLHIRIFGNFKVHSYPTQRMFRLQKKADDFSNINFPDSVRIVEVPWNVFDPRKFYEKIGIFNKNKIHNRIESSINSEMEFISSEVSKDKIEEILQNINTKIKNEFNEYGIRIYDFKLIT